MMNYDEIINMLKESGYSENQVDKAVEDLNVFVDDVMDIFNYISETFQEKLYKTTELIIQEKLKNKDYELYVKDNKVYANFQMDDISEALGNLIEDM